MLRPLTVVALQYVARLKLSPGQSSATRTRRYRLNEELGKGNWLLISISKLTIVSYRFIKARACKYPKIYKNVAEFAINTLCELNMILKM